MAERELSSESYDEDGNILIKKRKKPLNRQIEEGTFGIKDHDYDEDGVMRASFHGAERPEVENLDPDELVKISEQN